MQFWINYFVAVLHLLSSGLYCECKPLWKGLTFLSVLVLDLTHCLCQQQLVGATSKAGKKQLCLFFRYIILIPITERKFIVRFLCRIETYCTFETPFINHFFNMCIMSKPSSTCPKVRYLYPGVFHKHTYSIP